MKHRAHTESVWVLCFYFLGSFAGVLNERGVETALYVYDGGHVAPRSNPPMFERVRAWYSMHRAR